MTKTLVTGGAGFIGSHLCDRLLAEGNEVFVIDDFSSGTRSNLNLTHERLHLLEDDVRNVAHHAQALTGTKQIYHLAALISGHDSLTEPDHYLNVNLQGLLRVIDLCKDLENPRLVFASSSTVYGPAGPARKTEETPPQPMTVYALTKLMGEHLLATYRDMVGLSDVSLRLFNVYGPRQSPDHPYANVTCKFSHAAANGLPVKLYGDGLQSRDFVFVDDVVETLWQVGSRPTPERIYNVGTGVENSIAQLLALVQSQADRPLEVERLPPWPNDIRSIHAGLERLNRDLHCLPQTELESGLARTVEWFREQQR